MSFVCPSCKSTYKTQKWLDRHVKGGKCNSNLKRTSIPGALRKEVWDTYVGQRTSAKCLCCNKNEITPFTYCKTFHAGHIISHVNGGETVIDNLLPICRDCNMNMGSTNWDDYVETNHLPLRRCGKDPPIKKYMKGIVWWQSLARMWLERRNPSSEWRRRMEDRRLESKSCVLSKGVP